MAKIHRPIRKQYNAAGVERPPVASSVNYAASAYTPRTVAVNPSSIANAFGLPPIQEAIVPIAIAAFPGFDIEIQPPEGETWPDAKLSEAKKGIRQADKVVKSLSQIRFAFFDTCGFRHYLGNYSLATDGNWTLPVAYNRLPAESFGKAPTGASDADRYWKDPLLQGIIQDRRDGTQHFYQAQSQYGEPVEIPEEELLHIFWELPGNQSVIASILPTLEFWQFTRKCLGLAVQRVGVPNAVASFDLAAAQWFAEHSDGTLINGLPENINTFMEQIVQSQSIGTAFSLPPGGKLEYPPTTGADAATAVDQYIERKILMHLCPTTILDSIGATLSKSSQPALDLFILLSNGWREINAAPFEKFYTKLLQENGFSDATVYFNWWPIIQSDKTADHNMVIQDVMQGIATINEARLKVGYSELDDAGITALIEEHGKLSGNINML